MANLIFFFESISRYAELEENFQADITELFGIKRLCPRPGNYAYYFKALVDTMISTKRPFRRNDFRIRLIHEIMRLLESKFQQIAMIKFETSDAFVHVNQDMKRAAAWSELIAHTIKDLYNFESPMYYGVPEQIPKQYLNDESKRNQYKLKRQQERERQWYEFCANENKGKIHRTMEFDTEKLIGE